MYGTRTKPTLPGRTWRIRQGRGSRRSPSTRSGASGGTVAAVMGPEHPVQRVVVHDRLGTVGSSSTRSVARLTWLRGSGARGQDGPHVGGAPPAERDRPLERADQRVPTVGGLELDELVELGSQPCVPGRGRAGDERLRCRTERAEPFLRNGSRPHRPPRCRAWAAIVLVEHRCLAGCDQRVVGDDLAGARLDHQQPAIAAADFDDRADQPGGHRVTGRPERRAAQLRHRLLVFGRLLRRRRARHGAAVPPQAREPARVGRARPGRGAAGMEDGPPPDRNDEGAAGSTTEDGSTAAPRSVRGPLRSRLTSKHSAHAPKAGMRKPATRTLMAPCQRCPETSHSGPVRLRLILDSFVSVDP